MIAKIKELDPSLREELSRFCREKTIPGGTGYLRFASRLRLFFLLFLCSAAVTVLLGWGAADMTWEPTPYPRLILLGFLFLVSLWTLVLFVEWVRGISDPIRPFFLVTPQFVVQSDYGHGNLTWFRLKEATDFQSVDQYHNNNPGRYQGRRYDFHFGERQWSLFVPEPDINRVEEILQIARNTPAGSKTETGGWTGLLPADGPREIPPGLRGVTDPFGVFWLCVGALLLLATLAGIILVRIFD